MRIIMVNLYDYVTPLSSPYNIQTKGRNTHSTLLYLIFKTSKQGEGATIPFPSPPLSSPSPLTLFSPPPPNFQTHHRDM